jgi:hypothetical protein
MNSWSMPLPTAGSALVVIAFIALLRTAACKRREHRHYPAVAEALACLPVYSAPGQLPVPGFGE